jgi:hypothetical protein
MNLTGIRAKFLKEKLPNKFDQDGEVELRKAPILNCSINTGYQK